MEVQPISKPLYFLITAAISIFFTLIACIIIGSFNIYLIIILTSLLLVGCWQDTFTVKENNHAVLYDQYNNKLFSKKSYPEGFYWSHFFRLRIIEEEDATSNKYAIDVLGDTGNGIRSTLPVSLWIPIVNLYNFKRKGMNDAKESVIEDIEDSVKTFMATVTDNEIKTLQQGKGGLAKIIFPELTDTFKKTLKECGLESDLDKIQVRIGTLQLPASVTEANAKKTTALRVAEGLDVENSEKTKRTNDMLIDMLLTFVNPAKSKLSIRKNALQNLGFTEGNTATHADEFNIVDEMLTIVKKALPQKDSSNYLSSEKISELRNYAETQLNIREGRTNDNRYTGFEKTGVSPMLGIGKK
jgi:hypothetical protein